MESEQYLRIKTSVKRLLNIDLSSYKEEQMRRRLDSWLVRSGAPDWEDYFRQIGADPKELLNFRNYLTINVTEFFRDLDRWNMLREQILPLLMRNQSGRGLRVWSAGCSIGAEPYSLAILLAEAGLAGSQTLLATDMDRGALEKAKARGPYTPEEVRNVPPLLLRKYFELKDGKYYVAPAAAGMVTFKEQNLLADPFERNFDLIVCRNVIIYFTNEAKNLCYQKFSQALRPGGVLFLGGTEIIPRSFDSGLQNIGVTSFYIKE